MSDRFVAAADLIFEIETGDSTLGTHTDRKIFYVEPDEDGNAGQVEDAEDVDGSAVTGSNGSSCMQGEKVRLIPGVYVYWAESTNADGNACVSPAFEVLVEEKGTIRR